MNDEPIKPRSVKISPNDYAKYFGDSMPKKEVEDTIQKALDEYYKVHNIPLYKNDETPF